MALGGSAVKKIKVKGKTVTVYTIQDVMEHFALPWDGINHNGYKNGWIWDGRSMRHAPDHRDWVAVNGAKTHFRVREGEHHISVQDGRIIYWVESEQKAAS